MKHYSVENRLLKSKDKNGDTPLVYIACSPLRGPGKTFSAAKAIYERTVAKGRKFAIIIRNRGKLGQVADGVFGEMLAQKYPSVVFSEKIRMKGVYSEILSSTPDFDDENETENIITEGVGYVIPLAAYNDIKLVSSVFRDVDWLLFDEFMPEHDDVYLSNELELFLSIYDSVNRGGTGFGRDLKVIMLSNAIDIFNPYFKAFGLSGKIQTDTKFCKSEGVVFERADVKGLSEYRNETGIRAILNRSGATDEVKDNTWMNSNKALIEKPTGWGEADYYATLDYNGDLFAVKMYHQVNMYYIDKKIDKGCKSIYSLVLDGSINYPLIATNPICLTLKAAMQRVRVRFANTECKQMFFETLV